MEKNSANLAVLMFEESMGINVEIIEGAVLSFYVSYLLKGDLSHREPANVYIGLSCEEDMQFFMDSITALPDWDPDEREKNETNWWARLDTLCEIIAPAISKINCKIDTLVESQQAKIS